MSKSVIAKFTIELFSDGNVQVVGPIKSFVLFRQAMNLAERAILDMMKEEAERAQSGIVVPDTIMPVSKLERR